MKFKLHCENKEGVNRIFVYDNEESTLTAEGGEFVVNTTPPKGHVESAVAVSVDTPGIKSSDLKTLKISLGLSCNYECSYCSQRFVEHAEETNLNDVDAFVASLKSSLTSAPERIEFWGGEPFVYWKTMKPLAEKLRFMYPKALFTIVTNGSLLDKEKNQWLDVMGFQVGISHDGPGYHARGLDPMDDPEKREAIMDLAHRLGPKNRLSINAMMHKDNTSRAAVQTWMRERFGENVPIGEGTFVDPYDEGGLASMLRSNAEHVEYRKQSLFELRTDQTWNFLVSNTKTKEFAMSIKNQRPARSLSQKCVMDEQSNLAVDLNGNVLTCQNVSAASVAPNGKSHKIGHISDLASVKLNTSTHWSQRKECTSCPVLQLCKGACMFLEGELWNQACDGAFSDNIPYLAAGVELLTGFLPYYIEGPQREDRQDIFGLVRGVPAETKKPFPIPVVSANA